MKKCVNCGQELPDEAAYCPHCETSQVEKRLVEPPKRRRGAAAAAVCASVLIAAAGAALAAGGWREGDAPSPSAPIPAASVPAESMPAETAGQEDGLSGMGADMMYSSGGSSPDTETAQPMYSRALSTRLDLTVYSSSEELNSARTSSVAAPIRRR